MPHFRLFYDLSLYADHKDDGAIYCAQPKAGEEPLPQFPLPEEWEPIDAAELGQFGQSSGLLRTKTWITRAIHVEAKSDEHAREVAAEEIVRPEFPRDLGNGWLFAGFGELLQCDDIEDSNQETYLRCREQRAAAIEAMNYGDLKGKAALDATTLDESHAFKP